MNLTYDAVDAKGQSRRDTVDAPSSREAIETLRRRGLFVTRIHEEVRPAPNARLGAAAPSRARLPLGTLVLFTRQMAMLLRAGSGIVPAILAIKRQMRRPAQSAVLQQIVADLEEGTTLAESLRKHPGSFDPVYCAIVAAGEASGNLTRMFERLAEIVGKRRALRKKIIGSLTYPCLLIVMCLVIALVLMLFVLPRFGDMFVQLGVQPPATTQAMLYLGVYIHDHCVQIFTLAAALVVVVVLTLTSGAGRRWMINVQTQVPLFGRLRQRLIQAQILRTMGMLLESRVGLLDTLDLARRATGNRRFARLFDDLEQTVTEGGQLSTAFERSGVVEPYICQAVRTGEDSGNLGGAMSYCADILDENNTELIGVVTKMIEPVILILMGFFVGGVAISLFLPLFDLTAAVQ